jgi:hypothetical protein
MTCQIFWNSYRRWKVVKYTLCIATFYYLGTHDEDLLRKKMFKKGLALSQRFKRYPAWDNYIEPMIVVQFGIIFAGCSAFVKGMLSDNADIHEISVYKDTIEKELE